MRICVYCGERPGRTRDHVPPKCIFDFPLSTNVQRLTVPCCEECRLKGESDEALYRDLFVSTRESEGNGKAAKVALKRDRSFGLDFSQVKRVVRHMRVVGVAIGNATVPAYAFNFDSAEMNRFVLRMCRALLHIETNCGFRESRIVDWKVNPEAELRSPLLAIAKGREISEEFAYAGVFMKGRSKSVWLLNFYRALEFYVLMETDWGEDAEEG